MQNIPLNSLRAFAAIYEEGGVRAAARALEISHSAVSRHLRELQAWLGTDLFEGGGHRVEQLSPQGEHLGRTLLASFRGIEAAAAAVREGRRGNAVVLATTPSVAARWLLPRLGDLQQRFPWVELSVSAEQRVVDPGPGAAQLSLRMGAGPWPGVIAEPLMDEALFPVMSPTLWAANGRPADPAALAGMTLLHDRDPFATWEAWRAAFPQVRLDVRPGPRFSSSDMVLQAAAQGAGVALARGRLAERDLATGVLVRPFGDSQVTIADAYWIVRAERAVPSRAAEAVVAWLHEQARASPR
jgi:LysR family glycine cleavage system transcriptional activator